MSYLYSSIMGSRVGCSAYFNTTKAQLFGAPSSHEVEEARKLLRDKHIGFLFCPDDTCIVPELLLGDTLLKGFEDISHADLRAAV